MSNEHGQASTGGQEGRFSYRKYGCDYWARAVALMAVGGALLVAAAGACAAPRAAGRASPPTVSRQEATPKFRPLPHAPRDVFKAVLRAVSSGGSFDLESVQRELAESPPLVIDGGPAWASVYTNSIDCRNDRGGLDLVPSGLWRTLCATGGTVDRYVFYGPGGITRGDDPAKLLELSTQETTRLGLGAPEARSEAQSLHVPLQDVTQAFQIEWPGHFPFADQAMAFGRPNELLMIVQAVRDPLEAVITMTVYTRR
jgi:hypothetical protein